MGDRTSMSSNMNIGMGYTGISIWDTVYAYGHLSCRYGHPGYRYEIWVDDLGDDSIDIVILRIDMGYFATLLSPTLTAAATSRWYS